MDALIRNSRELEDACAKARAGGVLALDTEFVWRRTYDPLLCIVQCAGVDGDAHALDCLLGIDPAPLAAAVSDPATVKILHDAHQDLEHIHRYAGVCPCNVFDTQLAAAFAGFTGRLGLQKLLFEAINVGLPKTETLTDWSQRPLSAAQVEYALDDVRFLPRLRDELLARADALGTRAWLEADMLQYEDPALYADPDPRELWQRVKSGPVRLDGRARAALRELAAVRDAHAREWNLPRAWLTEDVSLAALAAGGPAPAASLRFRHRLPNNGLRDTLSGVYAAALERAAAVPEDEWPEPARPHYIKEVVDAASVAAEWLAKRAQEIHVDAGVIASRAALTAFVDGTYDVSNPLASGWRYEVAGREIAEKFGVD